MDKILKRDDFIILMEQKEYENLVSVNEGLLKNLFGVAKNLFRKDWKSIKGDTQIIRVYKELDDNLSGFSMMKLSKKGECNKIRQELVDFACDWYDLKMNKAKEDGTDPKPAKSMKFKNDTLRENLENLNKKIRDIAGEDEQMIKWAETLRDDMKIVINRSILEDMKDEEAKKELEAKIAEDMKKQEEINKVMEKWQNDQLKEIQTEREKLISDAQATPITEGSGDKAIGSLEDDYKNTKTNDEPDVKKISKDELLGLKSIFTKDDLDGDKDSISKTYKILDSFYDSLNKDLDKFKEVPAQSVQAMCIAVNAFVKICVFGDEKYDNLLPIMTKCAIVSDGTVSYNLPLNDQEGDKLGNYFTDTVGAIVNDIKKDPEKYDVPDEFVDNADKLFQRIVSGAKKLKEVSDNKYNEQLKSLNFNK